MLDVKKNQRERAPRSRSSKPPSMSPASFLGSESNPPPPMEAAALEHLLMDCGPQAPHPRKECLKMSKVHPQDLPKRPHHPLRRSVWILLFLQGLNLKYPLPRILSLSGRLKINPDQERPKSLPRTSVIRVDLEIIV